MITIQVDLKPLKKEFAKINKQTITRAVSKAISKVVLQIKKDVNPRVPRATGDLLNSWEVQKKDSLTVEAGFNIIYAQYQHQGMREDGTYIIRNRPAGGETYFLKKSVDANLQKYFDMYEEIILKELFNI
jgi:hypothetical protein